MRHFKKEHQSAPSAASWAAVQCLPVVLLELEIRSTRQELPSFLNPGISKTFTNARHVSATLHILEVSRKPHKTMAVQNLEIKAVRQWSFITVMKVI